MPDAKERATCALAAALRADLANAMKAPFELGLSGFKFFELGLSGFKFRGFAAVCSVSLGFVSAWAER